MNVKRTLISLATAGLALPFLLSQSTLAQADTVSIPPLYQCEPAIFNVSAVGNYTLEGRNADTRKLVFRARTDAGVTQVTWDAVDLAFNTTALILLIDQVSTSQTTTMQNTALVQDSPTGNSTCIKADSDKKTKATKKEKTMVPTIVGASLGGFFLLIILLVVFMMWRRRRERTDKYEESVDGNHDGDQQRASIPAGGNYMSKLVPGLKLEEARPLPRDRELEHQQADYAGTRRGMNFYKHNRDRSEGHDYELPSYGQSMRMSQAKRNKSIQSTTRDPPPPPPLVQTHTRTRSYNAHPQGSHNDDNHTYPYQADLSLEHNSSTNLHDPLEHHADTSRTLYNNWDHSRSSFLHRSPSK